jgi:hypothetical protein
MKKRILSLITAGALMFSMTAAVSAADAKVPVIQTDYGILGDINGDGQVDIMDALEVLKYLAQMDSVIEEGNDAWNNARLIRDSDPSIVTALEILKAISGMRSVFDAQ